MRTKPSMRISSRLCRRARVVRNGAKGENALHVTPDDERENTYQAQVAVPILAEGDAIGAVLLLSREPGVEMGTVEMKIAETAASFLGKQMEQ